MTAHIGGNVYRVEDSDCNVVDLKSSRLRLRKRYVIFFAHVSDDKKHDRFSMQHFSTAKLEWLEGYMIDEFHNNIQSHQHSWSVGRNYCSV